MGTSGSYGGSGKSTWRKVRQQFEAGVASGGGGAAGAGGAATAGNATGPATAGAGGGGSDAAVADTAAVIAAALVRDDPELRPRAPRIHGLPGLLPGVRVGHGGQGGGRVSGGGGGGGGGGTGFARGSGRTGTRRSVGRGIQRGASAIAAGYALREGNREVLREHHLDLDELQALGPRQRCDRILAAVLGDGNHPDEHALRRAAAEQLKEVIGREQPPEPVESIEAFIGNYIQQLGILEIRAQMTNGLDLGRVAEMERDLKRYITARVRTVRIQLRTAGAIPAAEIKDVAARIGQGAIRVLRAGARA